MDASRGLPRKKRVTHVPRVFAFCGDSLSDMSEQLIAAVDLGSNSFRLLIGKLEGEQIVPVSTWREGVRLAGGLSEQSLLSEAKIVEACEALTRFRERVVAVPKTRLRAVATSTYRVAKNAKELLRRSEEALGAPIDVISGTEEARLIYIGCAHSLPWSDDERLIVDIGGGSTEFVIGQGYEPRTMESFPLGAVTLSNAFFPDGMVTAAAFRKADVFVRSRLEVMESDYKRGWRTAYGSSGTVRALFEIVTENGFGTSITIDSLTALRDRLVADGRMQSVELAALKSNRAPVLPGGLAILLGLMRELSIEQTEPADGALRLGALYDLVQRSGNVGASEGDIRTRTVHRLQRRYGAAEAQAKRVNHVAQQLWQTLGRNEPDATLEWAASLHEIGMAVAHEDYHRHSAYIVEHAELPGFSERERHAVSQLVLGHTGSLKKLDRAEFDAELLQRLLCLRIAAIFAHGRSANTSSAALMRKNGGFVLKLDDDIRETKPLTWALLEEEVERAQRWGVELTLR
jgi:exopolyphosphatase / guanosine-5'-triphosphate,3'-diphosphate pyrophosphatase